MAIASDSARDRFDRDGFVVIENVLDAAELESLGAAVDAAVRARAGTDNRPVSEKPDYEQMFQQCMNLWEDNPGVRALTFHQGLGELAASLLGAETLRIWIDQALYKEPGGRPTDPHQDWPLWPISPARQVTAWIPFEGSTVSSGAMGYSPGSHHVGIADFSDVDRQVRATAHGDDVPYPFVDRTASFLQTNHLCVHAVVRQQLLMTALLHDAPFTQTDDAVGVPYRRQAVSDDKRRPSLCRRFGRVL